MVLLKAEHITKKYSGRTIIKDINIELHKENLFHFSESAVLERQLFSMSFLD